MLLQFRSWWLDVEKIGQTIFVRFANRTPLNEETAVTLEKYLLGLVRGVSRPQLVFNFGFVEYPNQLLIELVNSLDGQFRSLEGRLALCKIPLPLQEFCDEQKRPLQSPVYEEEEDALHALNAGTFPLASSRPVFALEEGVPAEVPSGEERCPEMSLEGVSV
jgi:hypothetical protein